MTYRKYDIEFSCHYGNFRVEDIPAENADQAEIVACNLVADDIIQNAKVQEIFEHEPTFRYSLKEYDEYVYRYRVIMHIKVSVDSPFHDGIGEIDWEKDVYTEDPNKETVVSNVIGMSDKIKGCTILTTHKASVDKLVLGLIK